MTVQSVTLNRVGSIRRTDVATAVASCWVVTLWWSATTLPLAEAFRSAALLRRHPSTTRLYSDWEDSANDSNQWNGLDDLMNTETDWQEMLNSRKDGSFWSDFEPSKENGEAENASAKVAPTSDEEESDAWLDTLASLSAEEVEFNMKEADRADKVRQMEEWQFTPEVIAATLGVATSSELENDEVQGMSTYREQSYLDDVDLETVESHSMVERDEETGELLRTQMVYVDEHTCIGCTNCATIAQSTFFMHSEVSGQWVLCIAGVSIRNMVPVSHFVCRHAARTRTCLSAMGR